MHAITLPGFASRLPASKYSIWEWSTSVWNSVTWCSLLDTGKLYGWEIFRWIVTHIQDKTYSREEHIENSQYESNSKRKLNSEVSYSEFSNVVFLVFKSWKLRIRILSFQDVPLWNMFYLVFFSSCRRALACDTKRQKERQAGRQWNEID